MLLDSIAHFGKILPQKEYHSTFLKFHNGQNNDLIDTRAALYEIDRNFLIVP